MRILLNRALCPASTLRNHNPPAHRAGNRLRTSQLTTEVAPAFRVLASALAISNAVAQVLAAILQEDVA
jgi:hypothetical protein